MAVQDLLDTAQRTCPGPTLHNAVGHFYDDELWPAVAPRSLQMASLVSCSTAAVNRKKSGLQRELGPNRRLGSPGFCWATS